jgi:tetratricopeptide (TPR) repeat protein
MVGFRLFLLQEVTGLTEDTLLRTMRDLIEAQLVIEESADGFTFRHALTREAVYASLLVRERKGLHKTIAETLENLYRGSLDAHLSDLALHYYMASAWEKASEYSQRAGEKAQALYAPREAIEHFTRALDATQQLSRPLPTPVLRMRGQAYEIVGDFEKAAADFETVCEVAHRAGDRRSEWQALLDLGKLWAGRDYVRTGDYFQRAQDLAQQTRDPAMLADSLNRIGNWKVNVEQPMQAQEAHQGALAIFRDRKDHRGLAETLDLLGMAHFLGGDVVQATNYYQEAIPLFEELDDREGLISSLTAVGAGNGASYLSDTTPPTSTTLVDGVGDCTRALKMAREIGWRSGEAYVLWALGIALGSQGDYAAALRSSANAVEIADEIGHRQWACAARWSLGAIYLDIFALSEAQSVLERALELAKEIGSLHWLRVVSAFLAFALIARNDLDRAETILNEALPRDLPALTIGQRLAWCACVELTLAGMRRRRSRCSGDSIPLLRRCVSPTYAAGSSPRSGEPKRRKASSLSRRR